ncbi:KH domain protein [Mycena kentingensis (nom. inval.)]|nr:KH domain protein [Mycena kentingensis (nom. inval.)]
MSDEVEILKSIYPDFISTRDSDISFVQLDVPVQLGEPTAFYFSDIETALQLSLSTLPPILLHIVLTEDYPSQNPPDVAIRSSWLPAALLMRLQLLLRQMWRAEECILFDWVECIRSGAFLADLGLRSASGVTIRYSGSHHIDAQFFTTYDDQTNSDTFAKQSYACAVCLTSVKGAQCIRLTCSHVFCRTCLDDFWSLHITEGSVDRLGCPDVQCTKDGRTATEEEIARVVSPAAVERWRWLRQKILFEKDPSLVHCPMSFCQHPVPRPPESASDSGADRLRICPACSFSFCGFCKRTWHGAVAECPTSQAEQVVHEYRAADAKKREFMEARYGRIILSKLVARYEEEQLNKKWMAESTTACPGCCLTIEKSIGCNHMTCSRCTTHFCYLCGKKLDHKNPYTHFSAVGSPCYNKLFDFQTSEDREWQPMFFE